MPLCTTADGDNMETTYWENCAWRCPREDCEGHLELVDDRDDPTERPGVREPVVKCYECGTVYDVTFEPRGGADTDE